MSRGGDHKNPKLPWITLTAHFVAYFVVFAWVPSTRSSFLLLFLTVGRGGGHDKDQIKIWLLFSISLTFILESFCYRCESFEIFPNCAVKQKLCRYKPCFILPSKHINRAMRAPALFRYFIKLHNFPLLDENCFY